MEIKYTTFSESAKRGANQDVCSVIEMETTMVMVSIEANIVNVIKFMCEKYSTDNYTGILAVVK